MRFHLRVPGLFLLASLCLISTSTPLGISAPLLPAPPPPILVSPTNGTVMDNGCAPKADIIKWDFDWSVVAGATAYHLRVWRNPALPIINLDVPSTSYHYASAPSDHIINTNLNGWRWMVRAKVRGVWGPWSRVGNFRVEKLNTDCP
jgi:hypothetical protein